MAIPTTLKKSTVDLPSSGIFSSEASPEGEPPTGIDPSSTICPNLEFKSLHGHLSWV
jgi:hypothetical protein